MSSWVGWNYQSIIGTVRVPDADVLEKIESGGGRTGEEVCLYRTIHHWIGLYVLPSNPVRSANKVVMEQVLMHILLIGKQWFENWWHLRLMASNIKLSIHLLYPPIPAHRMSL